jgi:hypothetical protein
VLIAEETIDAMRAEASGINLIRDMRLEFGSIASDGEWMLHNVLFQIVHTMLATDGHSGHSLKQAQYSPCLTCRKQVGDDGPCRDLYLDGRKHRWLNDGPGTI